MSAGPIHETVAGNRIKELEATIASLQAQNAELKESLSEQIDTGLEHADEVIALRERVAELTMNAERYQWLRANHFLTQASVTDSWIDKLMAEPPTPTPEEG